MKKSMLLIALMFTVVIAKAQMTPMQLSGPDCNGNNHDLFADLNAGKAVILHFFMPNCGSCPPPAQKIQAMANHILATHPGKITAYAMPYNNTTTCAATASWVTNNNLSLYMPYDSGATQVANYGGFGMPTVVLLGGTNHRVMFVTQSFATGDTVTMRDSILNLLDGPAGINNVNTTLSNISIYPNPANDNVTIQYEVKEASNIYIDIADITGKQLAIIVDEKQKGVITTKYNTSSLPNGNYTVRLLVNGVATTQKLNVAH